MAALVVVVLLLIVVGTRSNQDGDAGAADPPSRASIIPNGNLSYGKVNLDGVPIAKRTDRSAADPAVGKPAPTLVGQQFDGSPITFPNPGRPAVVVFVAHWCTQCQKEVPLISQWLAKNGMPDGVDLYAVATGTTDTRPNFPPSSWLAKEGWPVPTLADDATATAATAFGIGDLPYFVAVDPAGEVITRTSGELDMDAFDSLVGVARTVPAPHPGQTTRRP